MECGPFKVSTGVDRQTASTHLAKIFAFLACGKTASARPHIAALMGWLGSL